MISSFPTPFRWKKSLSRCAGGVVAGWRETILTANQEKVPTVDLEKPLLHRLYKNLPPVSLSSEHQQPNCGIRASRAW